MENNLFPHEKMRPSQKEFYTAAASAIRKGRILLASAPTGMGKTAAVLSAAIEQAGSRKILFLTSRRSQQEIVVKTAAEISRKLSGRGIGCVGIVAKEAMCIHPEVKGSSDLSTRCSGMIEQGMCGFYGMLKRESGDEAQRTVLSSPSAYQDIISAGIEKEVCPYYLALKAAKEADIVIADYNQVFRGNDGRFLERIGTAAEQTILIIDEAHNLPDRIREGMTSPAVLGIIAKALNSLKNTDVEGMIAEIDENAEKGGGGNPVDNESYMKIMRAIHGAENFLEEARAFFREMIFEKEKGMEAGDDNYRGLCRSPERCEKLEMAAQILLERMPKTGSALMDISDFIKLWCNANAPVVRYGGPYGPFLKYTDVRPVSSSVFDRVSSAVLMSGTLHPLKFYRDILGIDRKRAQMKRFPSPFPPENRRILITERTTTRYLERTDEMYELMATEIYHAVEGIRGNTAAFFPSYEVMREIEKRLPHSKISRSVLLEKQRMNGEDTARFLSMLRGGREDILLFAVQSGSLAEGLDFAGSSLSAVIVVGLPVPPPTPERKALQQLYADIFGKSQAFRLAYLYPAVNRVLQSAGRLIRGEKEKGVIILMDYRFSAARIRSLFPPDFRPVITVDVGKDCERIYEEWGTRETA